MEEIGKTIIGVLTFFIAVGGLSFFTYMIYRELKHGMDR